LEGSTISTRYFMAAKRIRTTLGNRLEHTLLMAGKLLAVVYKPEFDYSCLYKSLIYNN